MNKRALLLGLSIALVPSQQASAVSFGTFDPRSMAMGGAGVAAGTSANAGFFNPALLAAGREGEDFSLEFPIVGARVADRDDMIDTLDDFQSADYVDNFSAAVDQWNAATNSTELQAARDAVVSTGRDLVQGFGTLSNKALQAELFAGAVVGVPSKRVGASVQVSSRAVGGALLDVTQNDVSRINAIINGLENNDVSAVVDGNGDIIDPTDSLTSTLQGRGLVVSEAGVSLAHEFSVAGHPLALGITPKIMQVTTFDYRVDVNTGDLAIDQGEKSYTDFNFDLGVLHRYSNGWSTGLAAKNLIPQEYTTVLGNKVKLDPQVRWGVAYEWKAITVAGDVDLIENDPAGFDGPTQYAALGAEVNAWNIAQLRVGYRHNISDSDTSTASLGVGVSPFGVHLDLAVMGNSNEMGAGMQLGFRF